ncbi:MAG: hypothetical protein NWF01_05025 [Candidatus Bathyarchaeota archaeon]|nr:hypothetical protein [Candidatus Bathyarchaeota archaeon]
MGGKTLGLAVHGMLSAVRMKFPEKHDVSRAIPLTKESNGFCPHADTGLSKLTSL